MRRQDRYGSREEQVGDESRQAAELDASSGPATNADGDGGQGKVRKQSHGNGSVDHDGPLAWKGVDAGREADGVDRRRETSVNNRPLKQAACI